MDPTWLLSTNSNLFNSNPVYFSTPRNHLRLRLRSELSRIGPVYLARGLGAVDRRSSRPLISAEGGYRKPYAVPAGASDAAASSSDAIVLHVRGMLCEGCVGSVQRILESQEPVSSASVSLKTETAIVWPVSDAKVAPGWQKDLGEALSKHLTSCGFESNVRGGCTVVGYKGFLRQPFNFMSSVGASSASRVGLIEGGGTCNDDANLWLHKLEGITSPQA